MRGLMALMLAALPMAAAAQDIDCDNAMAQQEMNWCAEQDWLAADAELNAVWPMARAAMKEIDAGLPADMRGADKALLEAQRAWLAFRDAECAAAGWPMRGGTAEPLLIYGCLYTLTQQRTADLRALAEGY